MIGGREVRFVGGPLDGKTAVASGRRPAIVWGTERPTSLLDAELPEARWSEELRWYEADRGEARARAGIA